MYAHNIEESISSLRLDFYSIFFILAMFNTANKCRFYTKQLLVINVSVKMSSAFSEHMFVRIADG